MTKTSERGVTWLPHPPVAGPPTRPQFIDQDRTPWCLHAEAERRWLLDAVEWLMQQVAQMQKPGMIAGSRPQTSLIGRNALATPGAAPALHGNPRSNLIE